MAELLLQIIERAKTFQIFKWHYRSPDLFNPYKLASQGYQCVALNTLECHVCHNKVVFTNENQQQKRPQETSRQLLAHDNTCEYFGEVGKTFTRPQIYLRMDQLIQKVKESYKKKENQKLFPIVNYKKFAQSINENNQASILKALMSKYKMENKQVRISFVLTVMGWAKKSLQQIQCAFCGRSISVKDYKITTEDKQNIDAIYNEGQILDLFDEHRYFCFWAHGVKGWQIYIQHLYDILGQAEELFKNKDPQDLKIKKIRVLIDGFLQNFKAITNESFEKALKIMEECNQMIKDIEQNQAQNSKHKDEVQKRKKDMQQFLKDIQTQIKGPLKRVKID